jgi:molybdopterin converting factor small subunit
MQVRVLLFGPESVALGRDSVTIDLPAAGAACRDVSERLAAEYPALAPFLPASRLAVNHEFARPEQPVTPDDEIALIGLVSGG